MRYHMLTIVTRCMGNYRPLNLKVIWMFTRHSVEHLPPIPSLPPPSWLWGPYARSGCHGEIRGRRVSRCSLLLWLATGLSILYTRNRYTKHLLFFFLHLKWVCFIICMRSHVQTKWLIFFTLWLTTQFDWSQLLNNDERRKLFVIRRLFLQ